MFDLDNVRGEVIWLTGASGGLGPGIAKKFADAGFRIALHANRNRARAKSLAAKLAGDGHEVIVTGGDLSLAGVAEQVHHQVSELLAPPYALVHLAGPFARKPVIEHTREEFDTMLHGNLTSLFETCRAVVPGMRERKRGRIISIAMAGAHLTQPMRLTGPHLAAKSGVVALSRTLAIEEAEHGITVNVVSPGNIKQKDLDRETAKQQHAGSTFPMGYPGSYEDLADTMLFLLSPAASYLTGSVIEVTGGWMGDDWHPHDR
ncbi:SDR family oxidoreductase [bacterium]|nr:SDR family oxidoreductase [bacterium]